MTRRLRHRDRQARENVRGTLVRQRKTPPRVRERETHIVRTTEVDHVVRRSVPKWSQRQLRRSLACQPPQRFQVAIGNHTANRELTLYLGETCGADRIFEPVTSSNIRAEAIQPKISIPVPHGGLDIRERKNVVNRN